MRVCFNAITLASWGITTYTRELIREIAHLRPDIAMTVLVNNAAASRFDDIADLCTISPIKNRPALLAHLHANTILQGRFRPFDIIHTVGNIGLARCPVPQIVTVHDLYEKAAPDRFPLHKRIPMSLLVQGGLKAASAVISDSTSTTADIRRYYPGTSAPVTTIHLGCAFPEQKGRDVTERRGILFVGTLEPHKNLRTLLGAIKLLADDTISGKPSLTICGARGSAAAEIEELTATLGISDCITIEGEVSDKALAEHYLRARCLVLPSTCEGFGLPVIEGMRLGCPVLAARNSAMPEVGGNAARYFETMNTEDLASALIDVLGNNTLAARMQEEGLRHAASFTWKDTARQTLAVYDSVRR